MTPQEKFAQRIFDELMNAVEDVMENETVIAQAKANDFEHFAMGEVNNALNSAIVNRAIKYCVDGVEKCETPLSKNLCNLMGEQILSFAS